MNSLEELFRNPPPGSYAWRRKWETACHEAGHAVIGRVLGLDCGRVYIGDYGNTGGGAWIETAGEAGVIALMAGAEAAKIICGRRGREGDERDREKIISLVGADQRRDRLHTRKLIREHRACIEAIARLLMEHGEVDGIIVTGYVRASTGAVSNR